jgi:cyclic pyranopterin phosphate synthase
MGVTRSAAELGAAGKCRLVDPFQRAITYLRVSVTDRCDFRCVYCMAEDMTFPAEAGSPHAGRTRPAVHSLRREGVRKLRITAASRLSAATS